MRRGIWFLICAMSLLACAEPSSDSVTSEAPTPNNASDNTRTTSPNELADIKDVSDNIHLPAYDENWAIQPFWPGEYPLGFTVLYEGNAEPLRWAMHPKAPKVAQCWFQQGTAYHPWNAQAIKDLELKFFSATQKLILTFEKEATAYLDYEGQNRSVKNHVFHPGETLTLLSYLSEGYSLLEYKGERVILSLSEIDDAISWPKIDGQERRDPETHLWMSLKCGKGHPFVWIDDLSEDPAYHIGISPFVKEYGIAQNLTEEEIVELRAEP